jgi:pyruvate-formate lyase-activating enzyme
MGLPLLAKDRIKERIADALGPSGIEISGNVGLAAIFMLYDTARAILETGQPVMVESFFHHGKAERDLAPLLPLADAVLVHCTAEDDILLRRYAERINAPDRHRIHGDTHRVEDMRSYLADGTADPPSLPIPRLILDTTITFPDPSDVARRGRALLPRHSRPIERTL